MVKGAAKEADYAKTNAYNVWDVLENDKYTMAEKP